MAPAGGGTRVLTQEALRRIVDRVVEAARPDKIILFGSAARGVIGPNSDVDLLVVKAGDYHRRRLAQRIRQNLWGIEEAVDVVVVKPEDVERYKDEHSLIIAPALREGRVVYDA